MKKIIVFAFVISAFGAHSQNYIGISFTNFGQAPVPSFALKKPAVTFNVNAVLVKKRTFSFEFAPDFAINLKNGQGWYGDSWFTLRTLLDSAGRWRASVAVNWSLIFSEQADGTTKSTPYPTERYQLQFAPDKKNLFDVELWHTAAVPLKEGIQGNYLSFQYTRTQTIGPVALSGTANLFHLRYSDGTKGFAASGYVAASHTSGLFIGYRYMHTINAVHVTHGQSVTVGYVKRLVL